MLDLPDVNRSVGQEEVERRHCHAGMTVLVMTAADEDQPDDHRQVANHRESTPDPNLRVEAGNHLSRIGSLVHQRLELVLRLLQRRRAPPYGLGCAFLMSNRNGYQTDE